MAMEDDEEQWQSIVSAISSGLSLIGSLYMLGRYWYAQWKKAKTPELSSLHNLEITKELIHVLAWLDLINAFGRIFGAYPTDTFDQSKGEPVTAICKVQAFVITFGDGSLVVWNLVLAYNLFRWICMGEDQQTLQKKFKWYILATLTVALVVPSIALAFQKFGDSGTWCWIVVPDDRTEDLWWKLLSLYLWIVLGAIVMVILLVLVKIDLKRRLRSYDNEHVREAYNEVVHNLTLYIVGFIVCWIPGIVNRAYSAITGTDSFTLGIIHSSIVPLQGFVNALVYGKFHVWVGRHIVQADGTKTNSKHNKSSGDGLQKNAAPTGPERHHIGAASIFITTFDMNWNPFPSNLDTWIPPKKDLYVFSLQHCVNVIHVEQSIRQYLLRVNYPTAYRSITSLADTAFRGQTQNASVCQILFVNNTDDASGNFLFFADDGRKWAQRKTYKEMAGIPIRYFDASLAFVSCNLSSRHRSNDMSNDVTAKHEATTRLIRSFGMGSDSAAIDFPDLYHHIILSGNLNYDVDMPKPILAASIDQAYKAECLRRATDAAIELKLQAMRASRRGVCEIKEKESRASNGNIPADMNFQSLKSRNLCERTNYMSRDEDVVYKEVFSSHCDDLPFTLLESPASIPGTGINPINSDDNGCESTSENISLIINDDEKDTEQDYQSTNQTQWESFLDSLFPSQPPKQHLSQLSGLRPGTKGKSSVRKNTRTTNKKVSDLLVRSQLVGDNTTKKWKELLRFDQLRAAIEAKEVFCGFEEPPIQFLPSYPRQIGVSASFAIVADGSFKDVFDQVSLDFSKPGSAPAYKDRILAHSLQDTKQRLRNTGYWLCEEIDTSSHKPVCSLYELEIDRFFSYKMVEAAMADSKDTLRDKTGVREFKIKLVNLDANIWTYETEQSKKFLHHSPRAGIHRALPERSETTVPLGVGYDSSTSSSAESLSNRRSHLSARNKRRSLSNFVGRVLGKDRSESVASARTTNLNLYSDFASHDPYRSTDDSEDRISTFHLELVPVNPLNISTVFPLPSEDVYALQRKVYEVAHFVQNGFQSSAVDENIEQSQLAYTNFRTVSWKDACRNGVVHSAVTKPVNGGVHIAIIIEAEGGHGGQGVLCIREETIHKHTSATHHLQSDKHNRQVVGKSMMPSETKEATLLSIAAAVSSSLSIVGALYMLGRYWYGRKKKARAKELSSLHNLEVTKELIHVLAWLDLLISCGRIFGTHAAQTYDQDKDEPVTDVCKIQAFVISFGDCALVAWNLVMAYNLYRWICIGEDQQMLQKKIKWYMLATLIFGLSLPVVALEYNRFGDAGNWCWIVVTGKGYGEFYWKLATLYIWVVIGGGLMVILLVRVKIDMKKRLRSYENAHAREAYNGVVGNLILYILSFILCWIPGVVSRSYSAITGRDSFTLSMVHSIIVPLQGFINALIYGKFHRWVGRMVAFAHSTPRATSTFSHSGKLNDIGRAAETARRHYIGTASIFLTTFDMNWSMLPANLEDWIPPKKDLYVFSLQHCIGVRNVEQSIREYLLRVNYPATYRSIMSLANSAHRGQTQNASVCQILFVNNADDASGNFQFHANDGLKWAQRKTFKEVAGIPIRYFDASLAFVGCNLSSRHRSSNINSNVATKHSTTARLIASFGMDADNAAIDFPNLYHHTFLSGNLNYDVSVPKSILATSLEQAYKSECLKRATDSAIESKLKSMHEPKTLEPNAVPWPNTRAVSSRQISSTADDDLIYQEVFSSCCGDLPFTVLESPRSTKTPWFESSSRLDIQSRTTQKVEMKEDDRNEATRSLSNPVNTSGNQSEQDHNSIGSWNWASFIDNFFPAERPKQDLSQLSNLTSGYKYDRYGRQSVLGIARNNFKKISDLLVKSQTVAENAAKKWKDLLRYDELRAGMEAKEVLCGFDEPPIQFLPSYPRRVGSAASFAIGGEKLFTDLFDEMSLDESKPRASPSYKDRILVHSLQDSKQRIKNKGYWLCEEIVTSSHKPVCSLYELEIDRFFAFDMIEPAVLDTREALRDKTGVLEFQIKLMNLDANIWTYETHQNGSCGYNTSSTEHAEGHSTGCDPSSERYTESVANHRSSLARTSRRLSNSMNRVLGKNRSETGVTLRRISPNDNRNAATFARGSQAVAVYDRDRLAALSPFHLELVPVKPLNFITVFPLPSEDVYAQQRKVYEVAHFVQNGFQSSAVDEKIEESQLAYTNFRSVTWKNASRNGVVHTAVVKPVNGGVHIAIMIKAENGHGGQGVLCVREEDILKNAGSGVLEPQAMPFDVMLTWGGKHVGYLHGDILASL